MLAIAAVLLSLAALLAYVALRAGPLAPVAVTLTRVEQRALQPALSGIGSVEARRLHRIGPTAPGRLLRLAVEVGDAVRAGQLLGEMDPVDSDDRLRSQQRLVQRSTANLAEAAARLAHAEAQARRYEQLFAERVVTEELRAARRQDLVLASATHDALREELARTRSDLQALRAQRNSLHLIAPIDGVITAREAEPGSTLLAGQAVVELVDPTSLWVHARFDQVSAAGLAAGQPARVLLRSRPDQPIAARVQRTELRADAVTEELLAKLAFEAVPQPLPGLGERAELTVDLTPLPAGPTLPNAAVQRQGTQTGVWRLDGEHPVFVPVRLGRSDLDGHVQVLEGLKVGDAIVLHSERPLTERTRVQVVKRIAGTAA